MKAAKVQQHGEHIHVQARPCSDPCFTLFGHRQIVDHEQMHRSECKFELTNSTCGTHPKTWSQNCSHTHTQNAMAESRFIVDPDLAGSIAKRVGIIWVGRVGPLLSRTPLFLGTHRIAVGVVHWCASTSSVRRGISASFRATKEVT